MSMPLVTPPNGKSVYSVSSLLISNHQLGGTTKGIHPARRSRRGGLAKVEEYAPGGSGMSEGPKVDSFSGSIPFL